MCVCIPFFTECFSIIKAFNIQICDQLFVIIYLVHGWLIYIILFICMYFYIILVYLPLYISISTFDDSSTPSFSSSTIKNLDSFNSRCLNFVLSSQYKHYGKHILAIILGMSFPCDFPRTVDQVPIFYVDYY